MVVQWLTEHWLRWLIVDWTMPGQRLARQDEDPWPPRRQLSDLERQRGRTRRRCLMVVMVIVMVLVLMIVSGLVLVLVRVLLVLLVPASARSFSLMDSLLVPQQ